MTTRAEWAAGLLSVAGARPTPDKVAAIVAQASKENTTANWNPLATEEPWQGATEFNPDGVKNYATEADGLAATWATLRNGRYSDLLSFLSAEDPPADAWCSSPSMDVWGTGNCSAEAAEILNGDPQGLLTRPVTGAGGAPGPTPQPVPEGGAVVSLPILREGDGGPGLAGWSVKACQLILSQRTPGLVADGVFGPATEAAVVDFQRAAGLAEDGVVGQHTWTVLLTGQGTG